MGKRSKCEYAKGTLFNFEDFKPDIADLFMWFFPLWIWIWMPWNQLKKKSNFNWPDSMIERRRLYESRRPICIKIMQTGKNNRAFFWKMGVFFFKIQTRKFVLSSLTWGSKIKATHAEKEKATNWTENSVECLRIILENEEEMLSGTVL